MNDLELAGKRRTILIGISILLVSLHTIYYYHSVFEYVETKKNVQQVIRFILTVLLLIMVYRGKNWARLTLVILFSIATVWAVIGLTEVNRELIYKIPLMVMIFVYSVSIYHFGFSKSYKAFAEYQRGKEKY